MRRASGALALALGACAAVPSVPVVAPVSAPSAPVESPPSAWIAPLPWGLETISIALDRRRGAIWIAGVDTADPRRGAWIGRFDRDGELLASCDLVSQSRVILDDVAIDDAGNLRAIGLARQTIRVRDARGEIVGTIEPASPAQGSGPLRLVLGPSGELLSSSLETREIVAPPGRLEAAVMYDGWLLASPWTLPAMARIPGALLVLAGPGVARWDADGTLAPIGPLADFSILDGDGDAWFAHTSVENQDHAPPAQIEVGRVEGVGPRVVARLELGATSPDFPPSVWERGPAILLAASAGQATIATSFASSFRCGDRVIESATIDALVVTLDPTGACVAASTVGGEGVDVPVAIARAAEGSIALVLDSEGTNGTRSHVIARIAPDGRVLRTDVLPGRPVAAAAIAIDGDAVLVARGTESDDTVVRELRRQSW